MKEDGLYRLAPLTTRIPSVEKIHCREEQATQTEEDEAGQHLDFDVKGREGNFKKHKLLQDLKLWPS